MKQSDFKIVNALESPFFYKTLISSTLVEFRSSGFPPPLIERDNHPPSMGYRLLYDGRYVLPRHGGHYLCSDLLTCTNNYDLHYLIRKTSAFCLPETLALL